MCAQRQQQQQRFPNRSSSLSLSGFKIFRHFLFRLNFTKTWVWSAIWFIASIIVQVTTLWVLLFSVFKRVEGKRVWAFFKVSRKSDKRMVDSESIFLYLFFYYSTCLFYELHRWHWRVYNLTILSCHLIKKMRPKTQNSNWEREAKFIDEEETFNFHSSADRGSMGLGKIVQCQLHTRYHCGGRPERERRSVELRIDHRNLYYFTRALYCLMALRFVSFTFFFIGSGALLLLKFFFSGGLRDERKRRLFFGHSLLLLKLANDD